MKHNPIRKAPKEARAVHALMQDPTLSDAEVAAIAGCARTSLYRMPEFRKIRNLLKAQGKAEMPRGYKVRDTGNHGGTGVMEAWYERPKEE